MAKSEKGTVIKKMVPEKFPAIFGSLLLKKLFFFYSPIFFIKIQLYF
jgi:hypothetical protein